MEVELYPSWRDRPRAGLVRARLRRPRRAREQLLQRRAARQPRALPHRLRRRADGRGRVRDLLAQHRVQAVGEGNYGRLGADQQRRYTDADAETQFSQPATGGTPDEQPGAMPEIMPSFAPDGTVGTAPNIDRCWTCRSMFTQAWGHYATAWPVVHQQLGVRPQLGHGLLEVMPAGARRAAERAGDNIRLGAGSVDVLAAHDGKRYTTTTDTTNAPVGTFRIGHTLPRGSTVASVQLDGAAVAFTTRATSRGLEVWVPAGASQGHTLVVTAA